MSLKLTGSSAGSVSLDAPASTTGSADFTLTLPVAVGTAGQFLKNSSTPGTLEFGGTPASQVSFGAQLTGSAQTVSDNTDTKVICNSVDWNIGSGYDGSTGVFTVPSGFGGRYVFGYNIAVYDIDTDDRVDVKIYEGGSTASKLRKFRQTWYSHSSNQYAWLSNAQAVTVSAGEEIAIYVKPQTGSTSDVQTEYTVFYGYKIED